LNLLSEIWKQATVQDMDCKLEILYSNALIPILLPAGYSTGQLNKHDFHHLDFAPPVKHNQHFNIQQYVYKIINAVGCRDQTPWNSVFRPQHYLGIKITYA
jgi:hypothetical protein